MTLMENVHTSYHAVEPCCKLPGTETAWFMLQKARVLLYEKETLNPVPKPFRLSCGYYFHGLRNSVLTQSTHSIYRHCNIHCLIFGIFYPKGIPAVEHLYAHKTSALLFLCWGKLHSHLNFKACLKVVFTVIGAVHCQILVPILNFKKGIDLYPLALTRIPILPLSSVW